VHLGSAPAGAHDHPEAFHEEFQGLRWRVGRTLGFGGGFSAGGLAGFSGRLATFPPLGFKVSVGRPPGPVGFFGSAIADDLHWRPSVAHGSDRHEVPVLAPGDADPEAHQRLLHSLAYRQVLALRVGCVGLIACDRSGWCRRLAAAHPVPP
jgi:hypothetical protein